VHLSSYFGGGVSYLTQDDTCERGQGDDVKSGEKQVSEGNKRGEEKGRNRDCPFIQGPTNGT